MKTITVVGKNVAKAIEQGLEQLGKKQEDVDIKILDQGGIFRKAKVELSFDDGVEEASTEAPNEKDLLKNEKKQQKQTQKQEKKEQKESKKQKKVQDAEIEETTSEKENSKTQSLEEFCVEYLQMLFQKMGVEAEVSYSKVAGATTFNASGKNVNALIGHHGETLNAIQEILANAVKKVGYKNERVFFDVENYKNRREISLVSLAEKMAEKATKIGKPVRLERLNAYERRIVHTALAENQNVSTKSEGEEPNRVLIIIPNKQ